ncbi:hypothetical protein [Tropicimonas sp. IMCC6043]|uniref:hypothetical protein n=1 Tax=Tropicimonas sp. IMCC6043 TaxID=2510645 RepID=UPI00101D10A6|nr:hypothetical protein [Tropicimonas sp. IMCC6043]RYH09949.1 hypothetical protein EU800_10385 [Tropicimonas sp. IMCC6043]
MSPRTRVLLAAFLVSFPAIASGQELAYRGLGLELSHVANDPAQIGLGALGSVEMHFGRRFGLQGNLGGEYLTTDGDDQPAALFALHPFLRLGHGLSFGGYFLGRAAEDPATAAGVEIAWMARNGFTAEAYFGEAWGDELAEDGYATSKGATIGYTFSHDLYATLFFNKDTTSESGRTDRDYYDYGVGLDLPVDAAGRTHLTAGFGHIRFDAEGGPEAKLALGLTRQFGGSQQRPTFTWQRSVLTGLVGF